METDASGVHEPPGVPQPVLNIVGELVALGPLRRDLVPLFCRWRNDFRAMRFFDVPLPETVEHQLARFDDAVKAKDRAHFTLYERTGMRPIGDAGLFGIDHVNQTAEFGIFIGEPECWGKGYGTETARLVLDYGFTALGLHNIWLTVDEVNRGARRAYEKAGFKESGRRREAVRQGQRRWDLIEMDCLAREFVSPILARVFAPDEPRPPR